MKPMFDRFVDAVVARAAKRWPHIVHVHDVKPPPGKLMRVALTYADDDRDHCVTYSRYPTGWEKTMLVLRHTVEITTTESHARCARPMSDEDFLHDELLPLVQQAVYEKKDERTKTPFVPDGGASDG